MSVHRMLKYLIMADLVHSGISFAHLNIGSLLAGGKLEIFKSQLVTTNLDIFCLSESWLSEAIPTGQIALQGYTVYRLDRTWNDNGDPGYAKRGGGLLCYTKDSIPTSDTKFGYLNCSCKDLELQWISIQIKNLRPIVVLNAYRPPQGNYKTACKIINDSIAKAGMKENTEIFLMGDLNIDLKDKSSPSTKELLFTTGSNGLSPKISETTRHSCRNGVSKDSCIDHIFSNSTFIVESKVLDLNISDHSAVYVRRKKPRTFHKKIGFTGRSYRFFDKEDFQWSLIDANWEAFYQSKDPNECWDLIEEKIRDFLNHTCPLREFKVKEVREAWITDEILEEIKDKDYYLKIARTTRDERDWALARRERNRVGKLVRTARANFVKEQQREFRSDPKKFWTTISSVIPNNKQSQNIIRLVDKATGTEMEEKEVANSGNNFFSSIGSNLAEKLRDPWHFRGMVNEKECQQVTTDFEQVLNLCKDINTTKSSGISDIASRIFKHAFLVLVPQLVYLFNLSFETGIFPDSWKQATVIPLYKGGDRSDVENYRPISLLPLPGKLIEKIVHQNISIFLEDNKILTDKQNGFRKGCSTTTAVADLTDDLFTAINDSEMSIAVFVDLRKAFDTVNHNILCKKLEKYGIRNGVLKWCTNYLTNRKQRTLANNAKSESRNIVYGVPQGSVLGPLFFILYINDMQHALNDVNVQLYADDTVIYASGNVLSRVLNRVQTALTHLQTWCRSNKLTLNLAKTKMVTFGTRNALKLMGPHTLTLGGKKVQKVSSFKYLGFHLDATLNFKSHIADVMRKVMHKRVLLSRMMFFLTKEVALLIYKTMILPYFDYCDIVYHSACSSDLDMLQRLQNKCLKTCLGLHKLCETKVVHSLADCTYLDKRREMHMRNFMFTRKTTPELLNTRPVNTRSHDAPVFQVTFPHKETFKRSVKYCGAQLWNELPKEIRLLDDLSAFKFRQKKSLKS